MDWPLLAGVPAEEVRLLLSVARRRRFARNEVVFHRRDPADSLHLVVKGRFAIRVMTPLGETVTIGVRGDGDAFGEMALVSPDGTRSATVVALEEAETFAVYQGDFQELRKKHPSINEALIAFLASEVRRAERAAARGAVRPRRAARAPPPQRARGALRPGDGEVEVPLTQEALAEMAGTSRPTVNQVLRDEQERGTIELHRGKTVVLDREALAKRAR